MVETYICAIGGGKGGAGKSSTAVNLACALGQDGYEVALVDGDLRMPNLGRILSLEADASVQGVLSGNERLRDAFVTAELGTQVLVGNPTLEAYSQTDSSNFDEMLQELRGQFDIVLVDTGASISEGVARALIGSDGVVLVSNATAISLGDAKKIEELAGRLDSDVLGVVLTRLNRNFSPDQIGTILDRTEAMTDLPVLGIVPEYGGGSIEHPLVTTDGETPVAEAYRRLADDLVDVFASGPDRLSPSGQFEDRWFDGAGDTSLPDLPSTDTTEETTTTDDVTDDADDDGGLLL